MTEPHLGIIPESLQKSFERWGLDATHVFALGAGYLYSVGYIINAIALRNYGVHQFEALKLQYVEVGLCFTILSLLLTTIPTWAVLAHFGVRKQSGLPLYRLGATGYLFNTCNLFFLLVFFPLFITGGDWDVRIPLGCPFGGYLMNRVFMGYLTLAVSVLIFLPLVERLIVRKKWKVGLLYAGFVEPLRWGAVVMGLLFDRTLVCSLPWLKLLALRGSAYVGTLWFTYIVSLVIVFYIRKVGGPGRSPVLFVLGFVGVFVMFYVCVNAYVWSVLRFIPMNRGGKLPVVRSFLISSSPVLKNLPIAGSPIDGAVRFGPVYILEESDDYLYVASEGAGSWVREWVPIMAVKKDEVVFVVNERTDGLTSRPSLKPTLVPKTGASSSSSKSASSSGAPAFSGVSPHSDDTSTNDLRRASALGLNRRRLAVRHKMLVIAGRGNE
jgi:hypothetical protein